MTLHEQLGVEIEDIEVINITNGDRFYWYNEYPSGEYELIVYKIGNDGGTMGVLFYEESKYEI